jgi:glycosyltransferase involved in cell wall biosynthesis
MARLSQPRSESCGETRRPLGEPVWHGDGDVVSTRVATPLKSTVLITSLGRPNSLSACIGALTAQTLPPDEILVVWQSDDYQTRDVAVKLAETASVPVRTLHCPEVGIVSAANVGLDHSTGDVVLLIDDDAVPEPSWVAKHLAHFTDKSIGAVGGSYRNFDSHGRPSPERRPKVMGKIAWYGRFIGEMFDHPPEWRKRAPIPVEHLAGGNMSLRRRAFAVFNEGLRPYWHAFEADACLQVARNGYDIRFDFSNPVRHFPTRNIDNRRTGDLELKIFNPAYNQALILALHSPAHLYLPRLMYLLLVGSRHAPGLVGLFFSVRRHGSINIEIVILAGTLIACSAGWLAGTRARLGSHTRSPSKKQTRDCMLHTS